MGIGRGEWSYILGGWGRVDIFYGWVGLGGVGWGWVGISGAGHSF